MDSFYVKLLSNSSMSIYPENKQSAFTNKLHLPVTLDPSEWQVGLVDVYLNPFKLENGFKKRVRRELPFTSSIPSQSNLEFTIGGREIVITPEELEARAFFPHSIYFSDFLELLALKLVTLPNSEFEALKNGIITDLNNEIFPLDHVPFKKTNAENGVYRVLVPFMYAEQYEETYAHNTPTFIEIKKYKSLHEFFYNTFKQLDLNTRNYEEFKFAFELYFVRQIQRSKTIRSTDSAQAPPGMLMISLGELGEHLLLNNDSIRNLKASDGKLHYENLMSFMGWNIYPASDDFKAEVGDKIKEFLMGNRLDQEVEILQYDARTDHVISLPTGDGSRHDGVLRVASYKDMPSFVQQLISQIPLEKRDRDALIEASHYIHLSDFYAPKFFPQLPDKDKPKLPKSQWTVIGVEAPKPFENSDQPQSQTVSAANVQMPESKASVAPLASVNPIPFQAVTKEVLTDDSEIPVIVESVGTQRPNIAREEPILAHIYTDVVKPSFIGNTTTRHLAVLPLLKTDAQYHAVQNIQYHEANHGFIDNISIKITDNQGFQINFAPSICPIYLTLHFVRKSYKYSK